MSVLRTFYVAVFSLVSASNGTETHADRSPRAAMENDGTVHVPPFDLPLSPYMSEQSRARFIDEIGHGLNLSNIKMGDPDYIQKLRSAIDDQIRPKVERAKRQYPVRIERQSIGGVSVHVVTPESGVARENKHRVLINLHGGAFIAGAGGLHGIAESIPVSSMGRFRVLTVDYRIGPEHKFPAASEDVAAVYKELLHQHDAREIGIYGCSAGGTLSAMAVSWFQKEKLPVPGAIAMLSAAAFGNFYSPRSVGSWSGDSVYVARALSNAPLSPKDNQQPPRDWYLSEAEPSDPLVAPALWPTVLEKFPPTLLITGTRAHDLSAATQTHRELVKAGVQADLHLWDGMGHCFFLDADLPESREAYDVLVKFFKRHLSPE